MNTDSPENCELTVTAVAGFAQFAAHVECLRRAAHEPDHFPDLDTPGEESEEGEGPTEEERVAWAELDDVLADIHHADLDLDQTRAVIEELRAISARLYEA